MDELRETLFKKSEDITSYPEVRGYDFNQGIDYSQIFSSYFNTGFQATHLARAIDQLNQMLSWRLSDEPLKDTDFIKDPEERANVKCTIFFAYTSNIISCGLREMVRYLAQHRLVDVIVTTAGGIEEDFIKCLAPFYLGDFSLDGATLREKGLNRIGNLLVPNQHYCDFEEFAGPILDEMLVKQNNEGFSWTPSKVIELFGTKINNENSVYYWAAKNKIPVYCPGLTDGSIGDMLFVHRLNNAQGLKVDVVEDLVSLNSLSMACQRSGMFIIGGALPKHHTCNANLMRNGADYSVYINTGIEHEGSDSGAAPDEAVSWGKIKGSARPVKVFAEATLVLPIVMAESFVKYHQGHNEGCLGCKKSS